MSASGEHALTISKEEHPSPRAARRIGEAPRKEAEIVTRESGFRSAHASIFPRPTATKVRT